MVLFGVEIYDDDEDGTAMFSVFQNMKRFFWRSIS
jgi:hypothetical protein